MPDNNEAVKNYYCDKFKYILVSFPISNPLNATKKKKVKKTIVKKILSDVSFFTLCWLCSTIYSNNINTIRHVLKIIITPPLYLIIFS